jgi:Na+-driven multidrug efflux pump
VPIDIKSFASFFFHKAVSHLLIAIAAFLAEQGRCHSHGNSSSCCYCFACRGKYYRNIMSSGTGAFWLALLASSLIMADDVSGFHMPCCSLPSRQEQHHIGLSGKRGKHHRRGNFSNDSSHPIGGSTAKKGILSSSVSSSTKRFPRTGLTAKTQDDLIEENENNLSSSTPIIYSNESKFEATADTTSFASSSASVASNNNIVDNIKAASSKRHMLGFAIPALGIYLSNPLLSNIDNAFVGRMVGTTGLAALSPATICTDQMLFLFSFLGRATTGLVSRAYGRVKSDKEQQQQQQQGNNTQRAQEAGSPPLTAALVCGVGLSILYAFATPLFLTLMNVDPSLRPSAASYIYWRGSVAWAALSQSVALSVMMATRDAMTPLKIIGLSALVNILGDYLLCIWPLQWGCAGAAAATAVATLVSSGCMIQALKTKNLLPPIRIPTKQEVKGLMEFTGPLMTMTVTRLVGFVSMQRAAMRMGVQSTAAYQLSINLVLFFLLFGEPLSQLSQTTLPALLDAPTMTTTTTANNNNNDESVSFSDTTRMLIQETYKSVLALGAGTAVGIGSIAGLVLRFGSGLFSADLAVQELAKQASPAVFWMVAVGIFSGTCATCPAKEKKRDF